MLAPAFVALLVVLFVWVVPWSQQARLNREMALSVAAATPGIRLRPVQIVVHTLFTFLVFFTTISSAGLVRHSCINWRARKSRDMTVPSGSFRASAISR